ncbi:hypothetical protein ASG87_16815 [Frateuria sp. Soil773]|uniref:non-ribosomal peptide synthetase n=1 Tax=Frateuria sp. Soil773 TaxID=1736407 RepID=UPI0007014CF8|nr:non-ribosomal peptide synthetase [Frateuria sp. Soil773]KRE95919.1 hypothetical protein ASG87_16815 [Frateuria sp. Soil773]
MTETIFRLSPQQARQDALAPEAMMRLCLKFPAPREKTEVSAAIGRLLATHEILRTEIRSVPQGRFQFVQSQLATEPEPLDALQEHVRPRFGYALACNGAGQVESVWIATPAILLDAPSAPILAHQFSVALRGELAPPSLQYADLFDPDTQLGQMPPAGKGTATSTHSMKQLDLSAMRAAIAERASRWSVSVGALLMAMGSAWLHKLGASHIHLGFDARRDPELVNVLGRLDHVIAWLQPESQGLRLRGLAALIEERINREATADAALRAEIGAPATGVCEVICFEADADAVLQDLHLPLAGHEHGFRWLDDGQTLRLQWQFRSDRMEDAQADLFVAALPGWIDSALDQAELSGISMASAALENWYARLGLDHESAQMRFDSLPEAIAYWARTTPSAVALMSVDRPVRTYASLGEEVTRLGNALRLRGIVPGDRVAVAMGRTEAHLLAMLAVMASGAIYVPIDPSHPAARNRRVLADADVCLVLSDALSRDSELTAGLASSDLASLHYPDLGAEPIPLPSPPPQAAAYLVYTSGTTGDPKGVAVSHAAVCAYAQSLLARLTPPPAACFAALSTLAADLGYTSVFAALSSGGSYAILPDAVMLDGSRAAQAMNDWSVDFLKIVPSHWLALDEQARADGRVGMLPRAALIFGGDRLDDSILTRIRARAPSLRVFNHYGPTETTVGVLFGEVTTESSGVPLGRPLAHVAARVMDAAQELCLPGQEGELAFSGLSVAQGYWRQPSATALRFRPDPWSAQAGARLYLTGDYGRVTGTGMFHFLGRRDEQLKLGGLRVDLGEVQAGLKSLLGEKPVYILPDTRSAHTLLRAFVQSSSALDTADAAARLYDLLPKHMQPASIDVVPVLPLTANGKVDRSALLAIADRHEQSAMAAPESDTECWLRNLWAELLEIDVSMIGRHSNFFRIGGHSLLAARMLARTRLKYRCELSIRAFFQHATLAQFAGLVDAAGDAVVQAWLQAAPAQFSYPLSLGQERLWSIAASGQDDLAYNSAYVLRIRGALDEARLVESLETVMMRHQPLHSLILTDADGRPQAVPQERSAAVHFFDVRGLSVGDADGRIAAIGADMRDHPFHLDRELPIRVGLVRTDEEAWKLLVAVHHVAWDGWSNTVFLNDLLQVYVSGVQSLPVLPLRYGDFALSERAAVGHARIEASLRYWQRQLDGLPTLDLRGVDYARPRSPFQGGEVSRELPADLMPVIRSLTEATSVTCFMLGLAAWYLTLHRHSGQVDLAIGTSSANRSDPALEGLVGFFVNQLVLRVDMAGDPSFLALLQQVRGVVLQAFENDAAPFGMVVSRLANLRRPGRSPLYQGMFVMQSITRPMPQGSGLELEMEASGIEHAKFDLTLYLQETAPDRLRAALVYDHGLVQHKHAQQILDDYLDALSFVANEPSQTLSACMHHLDVQRDRRLASNKFQGLRARTSQGVAGNLPETMS